MSRHLDLRSEELSSDEGGGIHSLTVYYDTPTHTKVKFQNRL